MREKVRGGAMLELVLFSPWIFFLFIGALDWGFYSYALISVENAARVAALQTSNGPGLAADQSAACTAALMELKSLPNIGTSLTSCDAAPLIVTATALAGPDGADSSRVTVRYQTVKLFPIPGVLGSQYTFQRSVQMRVRI